MFQFIIIRLAQSVLVILVLATVVFALQRMTGDPVDLLLPQDASLEERARLTRVLGLDQSMPEQYVLFLKQLAQGDLGTSIRTDEPVAEMIFDRLPNSAKLAGAALVFALAVALPLGVAAAVYRRSVVDHVALLIATVGQSMPSFWFGIMLIQIFGVHFHVLPIAGMGGPKTYILPAITLGWFLAAGLMRLLRSSMIEELESDYVRYATIRGLSRPRVVFIHALRNALVPVISLGGVYVAALITGAVVVETVFAWPGIGRMAIDSISQRDYPVTQGIVMVAAALTLAANFAVDVAYGYLDPRVRVR